LYRRGPNKQLRKKRIEGGSVKKPGEETKKRGTEGQIAAQHSQQSPDRPDHEKVNFERPERNGNSFQEGIKRITGSVHNCGGGKKLGEFYMPRRRVVIAFQFSSKRGEGDRKRVGK